MELLVRSGAFQRKTHPAFGHDNEFGRVLRCAPIDDCGSGSDEIGHEQYIARAFRMRGDQRGWMFYTRRAQLSSGEGRVDNAGSLPDLHIVAAGLLADVIAQINVGEKENRL